MLFLQPSALNLKRGLRCGGSSNGERGSGSPAEFACSPLSLQARMAAAGQKEEEATRKRTEVGMKWSRGRCSETTKQQVF